MPRPIVDAPDAASRPKRPHAVPVVLRRRSTTRSRVVLTTRLTTTKSADREQRRARPCRHASSPSGAPARAGRRPRARPPRSPRPPPAHTQLACARSAATHASTTAARSSSRRPSRAREPRRSAQRARTRVGEHLGEQEAGVEERRACAIVAERGDRSAAVGETRRRASAKAGNRRPTPSRRVQVLDRRRSRCRRVDPPGRRDQVRVERLEADRLSAPRRVARSSAIERESCVHSSSSVKIDGVFRATPRPGVEREHATTIATAGNAASAVERVRRGRGLAHAALDRDGRRPRRSLGGGAEDDARVEVDLAADEPAGTSASAHAATIASRRSRGASGIVTNTMSGSRARAASRARASSPTHGHAVQPPPAQPRVVVDEADDALARRLAQLAQQAAAGAAGADDQRPARRPVAQRCASRARSRARRSASRRSRPCRCSASITKNAAREVAERPA